MVDEHPFQQLFESFGRYPIAHAESVNRQAYDALGETLSVPLDSLGRCVLLKAPRAGHGKTHLLTRVQHLLGATHEFIPIHAAEGSRIDAATVTDDALRRLVRPLPAAGGLCVLDLVVRRLFAEALQPLVKSGEVPCQDREGALAALRNRPTETFDFNHPNAVTAHWARENFEVLSPRLTLELAQRTDLPPREIAFWVEALFQFASTSIEQPGRSAALAQAAFAERAGDGVAMERLTALLGMLSLLMRVVLVADDLEGFSADEGAALRLAAFLSTLRQSVERLDVILSLNQDIWETAFLPRMSGGLADRLSEVVIELKPLTRGDMVALLESRAPGGVGARVLQHIEVGPGEGHARGLLRAAAATWIRAAQERRQASAAGEPAEGRPSPQPPARPSPSDPQDDPLYTQRHAALPTEVPVPAKVDEFPRQTSVAGAANGSGLEKSAAPPVADGPLEPSSGFEAVGWVPPAADAHRAAPARPTAAASEVLNQGPPKPAADHPPVKSKESDRVDDLLRQFRERYGRGGL